METPLSPFTLGPDETPQPVEVFEKYRYWILGGLLMTLAVGIYLILTPPKNALAGPDVQLAGSVTDIATPETASTKNKLVIDIAGGVVNPGVYWLDNGTIIEDAIAAAGGFSRLVDLDAVAHTINRAQELTNHGKIYIPKRGDNAVVYTSPSSSNLPANPLTSSPAKININSAANSELELLPGIGPVLAQRIVDYRLQNGPFTVIDDLQKVPGIGEKVFGQLKNLITI